MSRQDKPRPIPPPKPQSGPAAKKWETGFVGKYNTDPAIKKNPNAKLKIGNQRVPTPPPKPQSGPHAKPFVKGKTAGGYNTAFGSRPSNPMGAHRPTPNASTPPTGLTKAPKKVTFAPGTKPR